MGVVKYNGEIHWSPPIDIEAWCDPKGLGSWPNEMHECDLLFGFAAEKYSMQLNFLSNSSTMVMVHTLAISKFLFIIITDLEKLCNWLGSC